MMDLPHFKVDADRSGSHLTLYVEGEIDALTAPPLLDAYARNNSPAAAMVWIDLSSVSFFDSSGLVALQRLHTQVTEGGGIFKMVDPSPSVERILQLSGLDAIIPAYRRQTTDA